MGFEEAFSLLSMQTPAVHLGPAHFQLGLPREKLSPQFVDVLSDVRVVAVGVLGAIE